MKKLLYLLLPVSVFILSYKVEAQSPLGINYQAVARDASNAPLVSAGVSVRFSIYNSIGPDTVWIETHNKTTNAIGLFYATIGGGTKIGGSKTNFSDIPWGTGSYYLRVWVNNNDMGITPFLTVPYAFYADSARYVKNGGASIPVGTSGQTMRHDGTGWIANSLLFNNGSTIGVNTSTPSALTKFHTVFDSGYPLIWGSSTTNYGGLDYIVGTARIKALGTNKLGLGAAGGNDHLLIDANGNVGIGQPVPTAALEVFRSTGSIPLLKVQNNNSALGSDLVQLLTNGNGNGVNISQSGNGNGLNITLTNSGSSASSIKVVQSSSGIAADIQSSGADKSLSSVNSRTGTGILYGVYASKSGSDGANSSTGYAVYGIATGGALYNIGGYFTASGANNSIGVEGRSFGSGSYSRGGWFENVSTGSAGSQYGLYSVKSGNIGTGTGYGVYGEAIGTATENIGGYFTASGGTKNYAAIFDQGNVGIGVSGPANKLEVAFTSTASVSAVKIDYTNTAAAGGTRGGLFITHNANHPASIFSHGINVSSSNLGAGTAVAIGAYASGTVGSKRALEGSASGTGSNVSLFLSATGGDALVSGYSDWAMYSSGGNFYLGGNGHIKAAGVAPTLVIISAGSFSGFNLDATSTDVKGKVNGAGGTILPGDNATLKITFNKAYSAAPVVVVTNANATSPGDTRISTAVSTTTTDFTLYLQNNSGTATSGTVSFNYIVIE